ncbi:unnamed protein product [Gulo gulo]|uniref:Uncharacterized protein n=1 Tax=Gulo gulo TaxID=48420 RepID=A0A9X9LC72_GULGU|nr:unnamed protein product [Gulo gulo]
MAAGRRRLPPPAAATMAPSRDARPRRRPAPAPAAAGALGEPHQGGCAEAPASRRRRGSHEPRGRLWARRRPQRTGPCRPAALRRLTLTRGPWRRKRTPLRRPNSVLPSPTQLKPPSPSWE